MKLVITQGTTPFAQRIAKRVNSVDSIPICFASADPVPQVLLDTGHYRQIPAASHTTFVHELLKLALDQEATYVLPLGREEAILLSGSTLLFNEYGVRVLVPDAAFLADIEVIENPPRQLELHILDRGKSLLPAEGTPLDEALSGVFCLSDDRKPYLCLLQSDKQ